MQSSIPAPVGPSSGDTVSAILDSVGALIVFIDPTGRIVRFNSACEKLTGYRASEMEGKVVWDVLNPVVERETARSTFERMVAERHAGECEHHWITRHGDQRLISWSNTVLMPNGTDIEYVISTGVDITERVRLEREIIEVSEDERRRIGHELHERLCNHLAGTALIAEALAVDVRKGNGVDLEGLNQVARLVTDAVEQAQALARGLVPVKVDEEGLVAALKEMVADVQRLQGIACTFTAGVNLSEVGHSTTANHLYRIAQEAVANVVAHAKATHVNISLSLTSESLILTVSDDGVGIPTEPPPSGLGLHMMRYRTRMIGGSITIEPRRRAGTRVRCVVPASSSYPRRPANGSSSK